MKKTKLAVFFMAAAMMLSACGGSKAQNQQNNVSNDTQGTEQESQQQEAASLYRKYKKYKNRAMWTKPSTMCTQMKNFVDRVKIQNI